MVFSSSRLWDVIEMMSYTSLNIYSTDYRSDPYSYFKKLRAEAPVCRIQPYGYWAVSRYADVQMILKNPDIFVSSSIGSEPASNSPEFLLFSRGLIGTDKPDHTILRRYLGKAISHTMIRRLEIKIRKICQELLLDMMNRTVVDFIQEFAGLLPIHVISELLGINVEKKHEFRRWVNLLITWRQHKRTADVSNDISEMFYYMTDVIATRKKAPQQDLISALIVASEQNKCITSEDILGFIRLLLVAGTDTTTHLLGNAMHALLSHPDCMKHTREDPRLISNFIEESLRYDGPVVSLSRRVNRDVELCGTHIQKGEMVLPLLASANRDETLFSNAENFDFKRKDQRHIAFGTGIHYCFGAQLARMQARIAFEEIFKVFKSFERMDHKLIYTNTFFFRGLKALHIQVNRT